MKTSATICIVFSLMVLSLGCSEQPPAGSASNDLNERIDITPSLADASKRQVLVYVVNEPDRAAYERIVKWLSTKDGGAYRQVVEWLKRDLDRFPQVVERELGIIRNDAPKSVGIAIFSNELARKGKFLARTAGSDQFRECTLCDVELAKSMGPHPLTEVEGFVEVLNGISREFTPDSHQYVLVTKSHGSTEHLMANTMGQVLQEESESAFFEAIDKFLAEKGMSLDDQGRLVEVLVTSSGKGQLDINSDTTLDPNGETTLDPNGDTTLAPNGYSTLGADSAEATLGDGMASDTLGGKIMLSGLTKNRFMDTFCRQTAVLGLEFPVVFLESCRSELTADEMKVIRNAPRQTIGSLYTSDQTGLRFTTIDYHQLFQLIASKDNDLAAGMKAYMDIVQATQVPILAPDAAATLPTNK